MLRQRIITAVLLLAILLPAVFYPSAWAFSGVALILIAAAGWEWAKLNQYSGAVPIATGAICAMLCALTLASPMPMLQGAIVWLLVTAVWVLGGSWVLLRGVSQWALVPKVLRWLVGVMCLYAAWLSVTQARGLGINFLSSVLALVWAADIGAYFAGRGLGGRLFSRKLAPAVSPGKTWEGVIGGFALVLLVGALWIQADQRWGLDSVSLYSFLWAQGALFSILAIIWLTAWSVVGDLLESLIKRSAGVKDSSGLLPGHGGVLDRLDALLPVLPMAMLLHTI